MPYFVISFIAIVALVIPMVGENFQEEPLILAPITFVAVEMQKPLHSNIPAALKISAVQEIPEARLKIPRIGVDAVIREMGLTPNGAMAVPSNGVDVGWLGLGARPGETGSAVIGGHNFWDSEAGVFAHLDQLEKDDVLSIVDAKGVSTFFVVRDIRTYNATDIAIGIFGSESGAHLNLITCSGDWDPLTKSSKKRLVIFTDVIQASNEIAVVPI